ncbi:hypothetical protein SKTS_12610 [Sulfurimicrobium lacus]|uniref:Type IV pilus assembly protein PilX n=1 Tax=Sulfurimicrobium lacus TaxID=2715678 RepID=A0A6F8VC92_9PROT|nr:PilX N-terminal domain-containing pilus assembly protein [Sulfurimicrobium lacus]BCB26375.1 hypothetical protein SKTS_12610 [Sulfurimicrobium lacus]
MIPHNHGFLASGRTPRRERGVTLVIALIFLVMLTLIAVTAAQNSGQEERMAGNTRQRDLAFQAADATLSYVGANLSAILNITACPAPLPTKFSTAVTGFLAWDPTRDNDAAYWSSYNWAAQSITAPSTLGLTVIPLANWPSYVVEQLPNSAAAGPPPVTSCFYRVTVRGQGIDPNAVVILQAIYKYPS